MNTEQMEQQVSVAENGEKETAKTVSKPPKKRRRRWGDRADGRRLRTTSPMLKIAVMIAPALSPGVS